MTGTRNSGRDRHCVKAALAEVEKLHSDRNYRQASGLFYVEGVRNFINVVDRGLDISTLLFSEKLLTAPLARKLVRQSRRSGVPTVSLTPEQFRRISHTPRASGVSAILRQPWVELPKVSPQTGLCWVVLESVRSPGNFGSLIRTSEAIGGAGFILVGGRIDPFDPNVVRASMGSIFRQAFVRTTFSQLHRWMRSNHCCGVGASPDGAAELHQFHYPRSTLLVLGEERRGLTPQQRNLCQHFVRIPMVGKADSLNLAVAGSLLLYEVYRTAKK
ncbi:TrmH family RNA methyltransferase [Lusitaniella coriacea]|uniref:TrmH family RNA methyltransferase n=1 Tax=Lusitaniella coriacea TaxID=1983105 RepID=UPI003CE6B1DA